MGERELETPAILLRGRQAIDVSARLLDDPDGLQMRVGGHGLVGEPREVEHGLGGVIRAAVVMREAVVDLREPVGIDRFERARDRAVERPAPPRRQTLVGDVAGQAVGEGDERLAAPGLEVEELEAHQIVEV